MRKLSGLQWIIVLLTLATAIIHIFLGATTWSENSTFGALFVLDGIGYIVILALLYFSGRVGRGRSTMRWILILYALLTIILYFVINGSDAFSSTLGLITKAIEALLIILLFVDRGSDRVEVPAAAVVPTAVPTAGRTTAEIPTASRTASVPGPSAAAAAATAAATAAALAADDDIEETNVEIDERGPAMIGVYDAKDDIEGDESIGVSREALMAFFGDIDAMTDDEWRAKLMGHLRLIGDTSQFDEPIEFIEGIGDVLGRKWRAVNITKTVDLLVYGATRKGRTALAKRSGFDETQILNWANQVDLYRIVGIGKQFAELLEKSGVDTVVELAARNPGNLQKAMVAANEKHKMVGRTPNLSEVESWVQQAKTLPRVMHY